MGLEPTASSKSPKRTRPYRLFILPLMLIVCTIFYYFGELVNWASWDVLRINFFYGVHDVHRLLFFAPIIFAGHTGRIRGAIIVTLVTFVIFLPRAFFISPYPDPLLRMVLFTIVAGVVGILIGAVRNEVDQRRILEATLKSERDRLLSIVDGMADGAIITGPDYRIRFMNTHMIKAFGDGTGLTCYEHLHKAASPKDCRDDCQIPHVIDKEKIGKWACRLPNGQTYEILATPYIDNDGVVCQLSIFRDVTQRQTSPQGNSQV